MRRGDHHVFYHSNSISDLKRESKRSSKGASDPEMSRSGTPGTHLTQIGRSEVILLLIRVPFRTPFEVILELKMDAKMN